MRLSPPVDIPETAARLMPVVLLVIGLVLALSAAMA